jgi:hypothetical protein
MADEPIPADPLTTSAPFMDYLALLGLEDPTLAAYLDQTIGGLNTAVPPAGEFVTGPDYTTLYTSLSAQYVTEVILEYEALLGPTPELWDMAVSIGALTPEAAAGMQVTGVTETGTIDDQFAAQGGIRAMEGPHAAAEIEMMGKAMTDIQLATERASEEAFTLAQQPVETRVAALSNSAQALASLVNAGVSRMNQITASEAMIHAAEIGAPEPPPDQPPREMPLPPQPEQPEWWQQALGAIAGAAVPIGAAYLGRPQAPTGEENAEQIFARDQKLKELNANALFAQQHPSAGGGPITPADLQSEERPPSYGEDQISSGQLESTPSTWYPSAGGVPSGLEPSTPWGYGNDPAYNVIGPYDIPEFNDPASPTFGSMYDMKPGGYATPIQQPIMTDWSDLMANTSNTYSVYQPSYSYSAAQPTYGFGWEDYQAPSYSYSQPSYGFDWSDYSAPSYSYDAPDWSSYGDPSGGYWV